MNASVAGLGDRLRLVGIPDIFSLGAGLTERPLRLDIGSFFVLVYLAVLFMLDDLCC